MKKQTKNSRLHKSYNSRSLPIAFKEEGACPMCIMPKFKMCADVIRDWYETTKVPSSASRQNVSAGGRARACGSSSRRERASVPRSVVKRSVGHQDSRIETDSLNNSLSNDDSRGE